MGMGHLDDFDETHRIGFTQDGLHADAAHASLSTLCHILLLPQTRTSRFSVLVCVFYLSDRASRNHNNLLREGPSPLSF